MDLGGEPYAEEEGGGARRRRNAPCHCSVDLREADDLPFPWSMVVLQLSVITVVPGHREAVIYRNGACSFSEIRRKITMTTVGLHPRHQGHKMRLEGRESAPVKIIFDLGYS